MVMADLCARSFMSTWTRFMHPWSSATSPVFLTRISGKTRVVRRIVLSG
jgi:hypothetical protein